MKYLRLFYNPFEKLSECQGLAIGILSIPIISFLSYYTGGMFSDFLNFSGGAKNIGFLKILENTAAIFLVSALIFLLLGKLFSNSRVRIIDVFGYIFFSLTPLVFVPLLFLPEASNIFLFPPNPISQEWISHHFTFLAGTLITTAILPMIWSWVLMFNALKVSANLNGLKLWIAYIFGIILIVVIMRMLVSPAVVFGNYSTCLYSSSQYKTLLPSSSILGMYEGTLKFPMQNLRFRLFIENTGKLKVYATSPDQGNGKILITDFQTNGKEVTFTIPNLNIKFSGGFTNADGYSIKGIFKQNGYAVPLLLKKLNNIKI